LPNMLECGQKEKPMTDPAQEALQKAEEKYAVWLKRKSKLKHAPYIRADHDAHRLLTFRVKEIGQSPRNKPDFEKWGGEA
jgi:hypothetical protein